MSAQKTRKEKSKLLLPDYPFKSNFVHINNLRMHYVDEGGKDNPVILFLHGVPTWSFTFRNIFSHCVKEGNRVIAPDIPGFGKSDKPVEKSSYSLQILTEWITEFIWKLELKNIILFAHDWGVIIGLIVASKNPGHFSAIIVCNGMLPLFDQKAPKLFYFWKLFAKYSPLLPVGRIVNFATQRKLKREERFGYDIPFANKKEKVAIRALPQLIPLTKNNKGAGIIRECWEEMGKWDKPFLTVFSSRDPITRGGEKILQKRIPGAKNQSHRILNGKHFLQEDTPIELSRIITEFIKQLR